MMLDLDEVYQKVKKLQDLSVEQRVESPLLDDILEVTPELIALARKGLKYEAVECIPDGVTLVKRAERYEHALHRMHTLVTCNSQCLNRRFQGHYDYCAIEQADYIIELLKEHQ